MVHCYMLITALMFIFSKFFSFIFFGQIWSENLKFFKLTKNWYRGRFLYVYFDFNVHFFKIFVIHIFWANLVSKPEVLQINWNLVQAYIAICSLRFWYLFFQIFYQSYFFGQVWSQNLKFSKLTKIWYRRTLLYAYYDFNIYFFKFWSHNLKFYKVTETS